MSRQHYDVPSATGNPFSDEHRPKTNPTIQCPVQNPNADRDTQFARQAMGSFLAITIGCAFVGHVSAIAPVMVVVLAIGALIFLCVRSRSEHSQNLAPHAIAVLVSVLYYFAVVAIPALALVIPVLALVYLARIASQFRVHYLAVSTAGIFNQTIIDDFQKSHQLPPNVKPCSSITGFFDAVVSYLSYNRCNNRMPGMLQSPAGSRRWRILTVSFCVGILGFLSTANFAESSQYVQNPPEPTAHNTFLVIMFIIGHPLAAIPLWLTACFLATSSFVGKAYALKSHRPPSAVYNNLVRTIQNSADRIERGSIFLGWVDADRSPILQPIKQFLLHAWIVGKSGSGKTAYLMFLIDQFITRNDVSVVFVDLKADTNEVLACMKQATMKTAQNSGRHIPFKHFGLDVGTSSYLFDIFNQQWWQTLSPDQRAGVVLSTLSLLYSRSYGQSYYTDSVFKVTLFVLQRHPDIKSWVELHRRFQEAIQNAKSWELDSEEKRDGKHVLLVIYRLARISVINVEGHSPVVQQNAIDFANAFERPCHYYFGIGAIRSPLVAGEIARLVCGSLLQAATAIKRRRTKVILVIDEFQNMVTKELSEFLTMARSCGVGVVLSNQTASQLVTPDYDLTSVVEGNTSFQAWFAATDAAGREQLRQLGGQQIINLFSKTITKGSQNSSTSITQREEIKDRISNTLVSRVSSDPNQFILRLTDNAGYACYRDLAFVAQKIFHQGIREYKTCVAMPWPVQTAETLVNSTPPPSPPPLASSATRGGQNPPILPPVHRANTRRLGHRQKTNP